MNDLKMVHHAYIIDGLIDGDVVRRQARDRLLDKRGSEFTIVHYHRHGAGCVERCTQYHFNKVGDTCIHSVAERCPEPRP